MPLNFVATDAVSLGNGCEYVSMIVANAEESRKKPSMDIPNAFIGVKAPPSNKQVIMKLGSAAGTWKELIDWLKEQGITCTEWKSSSPKYGWSLPAVLKTRRIVYLVPCEGCFRASFALGDRAIIAASASDLPAAVLKEIAGAKRYAEGTGVRLIVRKPEDLASVRKLVEIKLEN